MKTIYRSPESLRHQQFGDLAPSQFLALFSRPISYHRKLVDVTGSVTSAIMLGQAIFWSDITADPEKWFYKSQEEWKKETGMNRAEQEGARKILRSLGFWEENYERLTHRLWFRVNPEKFQEVVGALLNSSNGECGKQAMANQDNQQSSNSAEITTETTKELLVLEKEPSKKPATILDHLTPQFDTPEFKEAWEGFVEHRKKVKAPLTSRAILLLSKDLRQWGCQKSIASIDQTVKNGKWTGLFEPKDFAHPMNGSKTPQSPAGYPDFLASPEGQQYAAQYPRWESIPAGCDFVKRDFHNWMKSKA